jgi:nicotinamide mononucleotide adenylyltransferase
VGLVIAMKNEKEYLIGALLDVKTHCRPLLRMITSCSTPDIAMMRWIAYIKSMDPEFKHIMEKNNLIADMLSLARYDGEEDMVDEEEDSGFNLYSTSLTRKEGLCLATPLELFWEESYEGEWLHIGRYLCTL